MISRASMLYISKIQFSKDGRIKAMIKMNLQFFGGNGAGGPSLGGGSGKPIDIQSRMDVWSYRHNQNNEPFVDAINDSIRTIENDFPGVMNSVYEVNAAKFGGEDNTHTLGAYGGGELMVNQNYTDIGKMNAVYDKAVAAGYHPSRGNKSGTEAVTLHEAGHALTDSLITATGSKDIDGAAKKIVDGAYKSSKGKGGTTKWAGGISKYAQESNAECIAEAVADWYCNGNKASSQSKAIMNEIKKYS